MFCGEIEEVVDKEALDFNAVFSGHFLGIGVHAVNLPVIEKLTQLGLCQLQRDGVCRSRGLLIVWTCGRHMAYSSNAVVQFLPAGTSFKQVHFYSGIEGTTGDCAEV